MKSNFWRMLAMVAAAGVAALVHGLLLGVSAQRLSAPGDGVTVREAMAWPNVLWVDSRSAMDYQQGHFPGALHLHPSDWESGLARLFEAWEPGVPVVVYCDGQSCDASRQMADRLRADLGLEPVFWLHGGWEELRKLGEVR